MSIQLQLRDNNSKGEKGIKRVLDRLEGHGLLVKKEVKKSYFKKDEGKSNLAARIGLSYEKIGFPEQPSTVSVYSFHCDLMLILKARLFTLKQLATHKVNNRNLLTHSSLTKEGSNEAYTIFAAEDARLIHL